MVICYLSSPEYCPTISTFLSSFLEIEISSTFLEIRMHLLFFFYHGLLFEIWSVRRVQKMIKRQFLWKVFNKSSFVIRSAIFQSHTDHCYRCSFQYYNISSPTYVHDLSNFFELWRRNLGFCYSVFDIFILSMKSFLIIPSR